MAAKDISSYSDLQKARLAYVPEYPAIFTQTNLALSEGNDIRLVSDDARIQEAFTHTYKSKKLNIVQAESSTPSPVLKVGVVLSGGQAPGGHNVIAGLFDYIKQLNGDSQLFGFLGGPKGVFTGKYVEITAENLAPYRNQGGFDIIGSGRDKIETEDQMRSCLSVCSDLDLDGLVVIGGDDSNTNAAILAEYFAKSEAKTKVVGAPKTIDGDLKGNDIEISFGFDTACKTYANLIGNIATDSNSAKKYYHFIRLMGRAASHITLECALETHPNFVFISEEVEQNKSSLQDLVSQLCDAISQRADVGKNFGVVLIPEGLPDFIPEVHDLIEELNDILSHSESAQEESVATSLTPKSKELFNFLPSEVRSQLLMDRDSHGNVQLSKIETEKLLISLVETELASRKAAGTYKGAFAAVNHFFGYEGRCSLPSKFDSDYCYSLGITAAALIRLGATGVMACVSNLHQSVSQWEPSGIPLATMMNLEKRKGKLVPVIKKALVELDSPAFLELKTHRQSWLMDDMYSSPGPIQFYGPCAEVKPASLTVGK